MQRQISLVQVSQCYVILKNLRPSAVVSAHLPNALPTQRFDDLRVSHKSQVTRRGLSYKELFFYYATIPGYTFHCDKRFAVVRKEGPVEGIFDK